MSTTLRDIAAAAGVSVGTVSRALKQQRGLSDTTRDQVHQAARDLGYDLSRLRSEPVQRLVFLLHQQHSNFASHPHFATVLHGVEDACRTSGLVPSLLVAGPTDPLRDGLRRHDPDVVLAAGYFEAGMVDVLRGLERPLVLVDFRVSGCASVSPDHAEGGRLATRHLLDNGRQRIAYLGDALARFSRCARGYRRALFEAGVPADPDLEVVAPAGLDLAPGAEAVMRRWLRQPQPPDAVFACDDTAARAVVRVCLAAGLRVPEDIAVVGFGDLPAPDPDPVPLSTLQVDWALLGRTAVELVRRGPQERPTALVLPVRLVQRASSAPAPAPAPAPENPLSACPRR